MDKTFKITDLNLDKTLTPDDDGGDVTLFGRPSLTSTPTEKGPTSLTEKGPPR